MTTLQLLCYLTVVVTLNTFRFAHLQTADKGTGSLKPSVAAENMKETDFIGSFGKRDLTTESLDYASTFTAINTRYARSMTSMSPLTSSIVPDLVDHTGTGTDYKAARIPGRVVVGGLFPVHGKGTDTMCGAIIADRGIQRLEAMLFTVDEINKRNDILPGVTLGANVLDTCSMDTYALEQSLEFIRGSLTTMDASDFHCSDGSEAEPKVPPVPVVGVIGGSYSSVSIQVANLLRLFKLPQISYASTSSDLSDKSRFNFFARTVPPDTFQAKALVDIVTLFNWTYVSTVHSAGDYGESGIESFKEEAVARNICLAVNLKISAQSTESSFDGIITNLLKRKTAKAVVLFLRGEDARGLLSAASRRNVSDFVWIASDGWGQQEMPVKGNEYAAEGALTIELQSNEIPEFTEYFLSIDPNNNTRNPWFKEYWEEENKCRFADSHPFTSNDTHVECTGKEILSHQKFKQETKVQFVYNAVYAMALALHNMQKEFCGNISLDNCTNLASFDGERLFNDYILKTKFNDGHGSFVEFDKQGDRLGIYNIMNYQRRFDKNTKKYVYRYKKVGVWQDKIDMNIGEIQWKNQTSSPPISECAPPCKLGEFKQGDKCCWICSNCSKPWMYLKNEFECEECPEGYWPTSPYKDSCYKLPQQHMRWDSVHAIIPMVLALVGINCTLLVIITFIKHNDTPIVKASGRELSYMLLSGCLICYIMTFVLLAKPSTFVCTTQRFGVGFGFAVIYAALLTKTNRISRIFNSATKSAKRPAFISPKSQMVISSILISIQVMTTCIWLAVEVPGTRKHFPDESRSEVVLKCKIQDLSFLLSLGYNMILIIICTVYAVKTRKIPENFNESKFIGFTMYTTCIIWLAFVPIYFGTLNSFEIQTTTLCISISLSASVALVCLFAPKMYVIIFQPKKNVRKRNMDTIKKLSYGAPSELIRLHAVALSPLNGPAPESTTGNCGTKDSAVETEKDSLNSFEECDYTPQNHNHQDSQKKL